MKNELTPIQHEVYEYLKKGVALKEVAHRINKSIFTTYYHATSIKRKLNMSSNRSLIEKGQDSINNTLPTMQHKVFTLLVNGLSNKEIARQINISPKTVDQYITKIYRKFRVSNRAQLISKYGATEVKERITKQQATHL